MSNFVDLCPMDEPSIPSMKFDLVLHRWYIFLCRWCSACFTESQFVLVLTWFPGFGEFEGCERAGRELGARTPKGARSKGGTGGGCFQGRSRPAGGRVKRTRCKCQLRVPVDECEACTGT